MRMCFSRSVSSCMASCNRPMRRDFSSLSAKAVSWDTAVSSASQSCHSLSPSERIGAFSEESPPRRRFMLVTSSSDTPSLVAMAERCSGCRSPSSKAEIWLLALRRLKNSFF